MKVLNHKNIVEEIEAEIVSWTDTEPFFEWELCFKDNEFLGVCIDNLTDEQIEKLKNKCANNEGFYNPDFEGIG